MVGKLNRVYLLVAFSTLLTLGGLSHAATLDSISTVAGAGLGSFTEDPFFPVAASTFAPNNDDEAFGSTNFLPIMDITFDQTKPIDVVFNVTNSGGTTEYDLIYTSLTNNTPDNWTGFRLELGFGTGTGFVAANGTGLDFDFPDLNNFPLGPGPFFDLDHQETSMTFLPAFPGDIIAPGDVGGPGFTLDVPDDDLVPDSAKIGGGYQFTLRHTPLVPLPPNDPPTVDDASRTLLINQFLDFTFNSADPENEPLTFELISFDGPFVAMAPNLDVSSGRLMWDATGSTLGQYQATVQVTDVGGLNATGILTVDLVDITPRTPGAVPEPTSITLVLMGGLLLARRSRKRHAVV